MPRKVEEGQGSILTRALAALSTSLAARFVHLSCVSDSDSERTKHGAQANRKCLIARDLTLAIQADSRPSRAPPHGGSREVPIYQRPPPKSGRRIALGLNSICCWICYLGKELQMYENSKLFAAFNGREDRGGIPAIDYVAIMAMQGLVAGFGNEPVQAHLIAIRAYDIAAAMLRESEKRSENLEPPEVRISRMNG